MAHAYLAFGANLGHPQRTLDDAIEELTSGTDVVLKASSKFYQTTPIGGPVGQPDYVNAVISVETTLVARALLDRCLLVENLFGRIRQERWSPRTLDIDLLLYDNQVIDEPLLKVPHPRLRERLFVLIPLSDIAPDTLALPPDGLQLRDILAKTLLETEQTGFQIVPV